MDITKKHASGIGELAFVVEKLQLIGYAGFWVVVLAGIIITKAFGHVDMDHTVLMEAFGYNNICVYFDHPPATYVLPGLWAITLVFLLSYMAGHVLQLRAEVLEGLLDLRTYRLLLKMKLFEAFTMVMFSTIFAVSPEGWDLTLYIHTVPFFLLQIGLVSLALSNAIHGIKSTYWRRLDMPLWFESAAKIYVALFAVIVCFKIPTAVNAMAHSLWWKQTPGFVSVAHVFDVSFLIFAAIVPVVVAAYIVRAKEPNLKIVHLISFMDIMKLKSLVLSKENTEKQL